jgi:hypothetical protein
LGARNPNRIVKTGNGHLYLREEKLSFINNYISKVAAKTKFDFVR